jgi:hypothetical protein
VRPETILACRSECLDRFVIVGDRHLRHLIREFAIQYHTERYHQGLGSQIIMPMPLPSNDNAPLSAIACRSRLGGLLSFYRREPARRAATAFRLFRHHALRCNKPSSPSGSLQATDQIDAMYLPKYPNAPVTRGDRSCSHSWLMTVSANNANGVFVHLGKTTATFLRASLPIQCTRPKPLESPDCAGHHHTNNAHQP